jgi:hypothetical protein
MHARPTSQGAPHAVERARVVDGHLEYTPPTIIGAAEVHHLFDTVAGFLAQPPRDLDVNPLRILLDMRVASTFHRDLRPAVYARHAEFRGHRIAVIGNSRFHWGLVTFLLAATRHTGTRYFTDEVKARAWLREVSLDA